MLINDFIEFDIKEYIETFIEESPKYKKYYLLLRPEPYKVEKSTSNIYYKEGKNSKLVSTMFKKAAILAFLFYS
jgi:hypothetical protein